MKKLRRLWRSTRDYLPFVLIALFGAGFLVFVISVEIESHGDSTRREQRQQQGYRDTYAAWCKFTDNPKSLTFEEWQLLRRSGILTVEGS